MPPLSAHSASKTKRCYRRTGYLDPLASGHFDAMARQLNGYFKEKDSPRTKRNSAGLRSKRNRMRKTHPLAPMQTKLLAEAQVHGLSESVLMDRLSNLGLISNEAIWLEDVAESSAKECLGKGPWLE